MFKRWILRRWAIPAIVMAAALVVVSFTAFSAPVASSAGPVNAAAAANVAAKLEALHQRARARVQEDEAAITTTAPKITPERAAQLAVKARGGGQVQWIGLTTHNGKAAYEVRVGESTIATVAAAAAMRPVSTHYVDVQTGVVMAK